MAIVSTLASEIASEIGEDYSNDTSVATQFDTWVADVVAEIQTRYRHYFQNAKTTETFVTSTGTYTLPADCSEVRLVRVQETDDVLGATSVEELAIWGIDMDGDGTPQYWTIDEYSSGAMVLAIYPAPDGDANGNTLEIHYIKSQDSLSSGSTIPLPDEFLPIIKEGVRAKSAWADHDLQGAQLAEQMLEQQLARQEQKLLGLARPPARIAGNAIPHVPQTPAADGG